jgi:hypothetical protein
VELGAAHRSHRRVTKPTRRSASDRGLHRTDTKIYRSIDELQADLDEWVRSYNEQRSHQGIWCFGKTPMQTFLDAMPLAKQKMIAA